MSKKGFVMIETIIVITVLTVGLISLYVSYSTLISRAQVKNTYENVEYIYKAYTVGSFIKDNIGISTDAVYKKSTVSNSSLRKIMEDFDIDKVYVFKPSNTPPTFTYSNLDGSSIMFLDQWESFVSNQVNFVVKFKTGEEPTEEINFASIAIE